MSLISFVTLNILVSVYGDIRFPVLTAPLGSFNSPSLKASYTDTNPGYYNKITTYDTWKTVRNVTGKVKTFEIIANSSLQTLFYEASALLGRNQLFAEIFDQVKLYDCPNDCYFVKDADILAVRTLDLTISNLAEVQAYTVKELYEFAVAAMQQKFCFNMTTLEQKLNLSSLHVINDQWRLFVPDIVNASVNCRADQLGVTVDGLAGLLNTSTSTLLGYHMNEAENIFFPAFDDILSSKN